MALKAILESIDDLTEELQGEYVEKEIDGKKVFVLDIVDAPSHPSVKALKNALDRQKEDNKKLKTEKGELEAKLKDFPDDFTLDEWHRLQELDDVDPNDPDKDKKKKEKQDERLAQAKRNYEQQIAALKKKYDDDMAAANEKLASERGARAGDKKERELSEAIAAAGIDVKYTRAVKALLKDVVKHAIEDDGTLRTYVETDLGEEEVSKYVATWAQSDEGKIYIAPAAGGGATGNERGAGGAAMGDNPFKAALWNKTQQAALVKTDRVKAERLAKAAGFKNLDVAIAARSAITSDK